MNIIKAVKIALFFVLFFSMKGIAQDTLNSAIVEQKSYQLYLDKNWNELIKFGNRAINSGFDYYYLQIRIGIAYFEKKNYSLAENHFKNTALILYPSMFLVIQNCKQITPTSQSTFNSQD